MLQLRRRLTPLLIVASCTIGSVAVLTAGSASAATFPNAKIAEAAEARVGSWGDWCKVFVNNVVRTASGGAVNLTGYHAGFAAAGGREVGRDDAVRGDIIQITPAGSDDRSAEGAWRFGDKSRSLHTAIIVANRGGGNFDVVDSNFSNNQDKMVRRHVLNPYSWASGSIIKIWRLGTTAPVDPFGALDVVQRAPRGVYVAGWAVDRDKATSPIQVNLHAGSGAAGSAPGLAFTANQERADVARAHSGVGSKHGFSDVFPLPPGQHNVCAYAINVGPGNIKQIGCKRVNIAASPIGSLDTVTPVTGGVDVAGWAIDQDTAAPIDVRIYGGTGAAGTGQPGATVKADRERPDVARVHPHYGAKHGYRAFLELAPGQHTVCASGLNAARTSGADAGVGCKTVTVV